MLQIMAEKDAVSRFAEDVRVDKSVRRLYRLILLLLVNVALALWVVIGIVVLAFLYSNHNVAEA